MKGFMWVLSEQEQIPSDFSRRSSYVSFPGLTAYSDQSDFCRSSYVSFPGSLRTQIDIHASWASVNRHLDFNSPHVHPDATLSGALYLQAQHSDSFLIFSDPRSPQLPWAGREERLQPQDASIVLFPSYLEHRVTPHLSKVAMVCCGDIRMADVMQEPRVLIAFNALVRPAAPGSSLAIPRRHHAGLP